VGGEKERRRHNLGLLFIIPESKISNHWQKIGITPPAVDDKFFAKLDRTKLPPRIKELFDAEPAKIADVFGRLRLQAISWRSLCDDISEIEREANSVGHRNQTLQRLLAGLRKQIEQHKYTGLAGISGVRRQEWRNPSIE
jgi:hypothetical protein